MISKRETFIASALAVALVGGGFAVGHESQKLTARADGLFIALSTDQQTRIFGLETVE